MATKTTKIKLARTTANGLYLNPEYTSYYQGESITQVQPWVQTYNKQLWIDAVCINPKLTISPVSYSLNDEERQFSFASLTKSVNNNTSLCTNNLTFDFAGLKNYFNNTNYFNALRFRQAQRNANGVIVTTGNNGYSYDEPITVYNPVCGISQLPEIFFGRNLKATTVEGKNIIIESQYISSITTMLGSDLRNALGRAGGSGVQTLYLEHDAATNDVIDNDAVYLVITSNFGLSKYIKLADIAGYSVFHDPINVTTTSTAVNNAQYIFTHDIQLYTGTDINKGVKFISTSPDSNQLGTDVYFQIPVETTDITPVQIVVCVIDGGEILPPPEI